MLKTYTRRIPQNELTSMRVQAANEAALEASSGTPSLDPFQTPNKLGCGMVFKPHWCFLEQMLAISRHPAHSNRKRSV